MPALIDGRPQNEVQVGPDKLEVVASFCYLGDMLSAGGGCEIAVTTRVKTTWKKFTELLPVLTSQVLSFNYFKMHAWSTSMLLLLHSAYMLSVVKMLPKGEVRGCALNSLGNYIVDH